VKLSLLIRNQIAEKSIIGSSTPAQAYMDKVIVFQSYLQYFVLIEVPTRVRAYIQKDKKTYFAL